MGIADFGPKFGCRFWVWGFFIGMVTSQPLKHSLVNKPLGLWLQALIPGMALAPAIEALHWLGAWHWLKANKSKPNWDPGILGSYDLGILGS